MTDYLPFKHGDEGEGSTHFACQEMIDKLGDKVGCCGCNHCPLCSPRKDKMTLREKIKQCLWYDKDNDQTEFVVDQLEKLIKEQRKEIDHSIDVRYEQDLLIAFNKFIKKWCGDYYPHLIDDDENDGEYMREKIRNLNKLNKQEKKK